MLGNPSRQPPIVANLQPGIITPPLKRKRKLSRSDWWEIKILAFIVTLLLVGAWFVGQESWRVVG